MDSTNSVCFNSGVSLSVTTTSVKILGTGNMNYMQKGTTTALIIAISTAHNFVFPVLLFAPTLTSLFTQDEGTCI